MQLVVDIGNTVKAGLFEGDRLLHTLQAAKPDQIIDFLKDMKIEKALVASEEAGKGRDLTALLTAAGHPCQLLNNDGYMRLGTEETQPLLQPSKIANIFGALYHFPSNNCIIIDLGGLIRFDYVSSRGVYLGGAVFPNFETVFTAMAKTSFPDLGGETPAPLGKDLLQQTKSGCYFGLLGAIERIVAELRLSSETPTSVMTIATGALTNSPAIKKDLEDFIDQVDPHLTLIGLNQIIQEDKS